jgi:hypothetical protein
MLQLFVQLFVAYSYKLLATCRRARKKKWTIVFFFVRYQYRVTSQTKKTAKKTAKRGFTKKEACRREKYVENWYYPTYYQAYVKMSNGDPHRMKPSLSQTSAYPEVATCHIIAISQDCRS